MILAPSINLTLELWLAQSLKSRPVVVVVEQLLVITQIPVVPLRTLAVLRIFILTSVSLVL